MLPRSPSVSSQTYKNRRKSFAGWATIHLAQRFTIIKEFGFIRTVQPSLYELKNGLAEKLARKTRLPTGTLGGIQWTI